jgi:hypothetical protein
VAEMTIVYLEKSPIEYRVEFRTKDSDWMPWNKDVTYWEPFVSCLPVQYPELEFSVVRTIVERGILT